jgi:hypothetical protein
LSKLKNKLKIKKEKKYESKTIQEVHEIIIDAVLLVCDMTREQIVVKIMYELVDLVL